MVFDDCLARGCWVGWGSFRDYEIIQPKTLEVKNNLRIYIDTREDRQRHGHVEVPA